METWLNWLQTYWLEVLLILVIMQLLVGMWCVVTTIRLHQQKQLIKKLLEPARENTLKTILASDRADQDTVLGYLYHLDESARRLKGNIGLVRYNAIGEQASDMSFSLALLDEYQDGVVISSLFSHQGQSYIYAKPVEKGDSSYRLSKEERQAIQRAIKPTVEREDSMQVDTENGNESNTKT
ncbi:DUF4446 family protein [Desmospora activa]|uniref:Uncharacterized protein DUF4446 n=1 Tax=Desmospora activa DSM 45169 TaxID=1121389 RepID=A0A2T4Z4S7_9BACL|nr:DUF4446 family protein [Desmospora activa]PTM56893.1 uncharacterized protein DUF4446 [Desmospora activa DSM 45169]